MNGNLKYNKEQLGKAPGTLLFTGERKVAKTNIEVIEFNEEEIRVFDDHEVHDLERFKDTQAISWINVTGLHDISVIQKIGEVFDLHLLLLEDLLNTNQRPKFEEFDRKIFLTLKMLRAENDGSAMLTEQLSFLVGDHYLITFQETFGDVFEPVRGRLLRPTTKIRHRKSDYLAYALIDHVVDQYIFIIEGFGEKVAALERALIADARQAHLKTLYQYKQEINYLRKTIRPVRDLVLDYKTADSNLIEEQTLSYIRDLEDHITLASDSIETYHLMLTDQLNLYQSIANNRLNDILRVLTIFSVIFIPLTFLAGIYGTNFKYVPELEYQYAYPIFWGVLISIGTGMMIFFKRKKWW